MVFKFKNLTVIFVTIIVTNIFFKEINTKIFEDDLIIKIIIKIILAIFTLLFLSKFKLLSNIKNNKKSLFFNLLSLVLISLSYYYVNEQIKIFNLNISYSKHIQFLFSCLSVGLFEELFFRIFIFYFMINIFKKDDKRTLKSMIITSLFFGLSHFSNFLNTEYYKLSVIYQSLFAISIGIVLQSMYIKFKSLTFIITLHGLINYYGSYKSKFFDIYSNINKIDENDDFLSTLFFLVIFMVISLIFSYFLLRKEINNNVV